MNIFLTGASGFVGSNIVKESILYKEYNIVAHSRRLISSSPNVNNLQCEFSEIDSSDIKDCDVIVHCASEGVKNIDTSLLKCIQFNYYQTLKFLSEAYYAGCKKWIILGTSSEYGATLKKKKKIDKCDDLIPLDNYSISKVILYESLQYLSNILDINILYLRLFPVYGVGEYSKRLIPQMVLALKNKKVFNLNNPDALIDYSRIDDVVRSIFNSVGYLLQSKKSFEKFHLASGEYTTIEQFALNFWLSNGGNMDMFKVNNADDIVFHHISNIKSIFKV